MRCHFIHLFLGAETLEVESEREKSITAAAAASRTSRVQVHLRKGGGTKGGQ